MHDKIFKKWKFWKIFATNINRKKIRPEQELQSSLWFINITDQEETNNRKCLRFQKLMYCMINGKQILFTIEAPFIIQL